MSKESLRKFLMEDVPGVVEIHNSNNPENQMTVEELETYEKNRNPERILGQWVIEVEGRVAAYADCGEVNATTTEDALHCWITVHTDFRGKGYGVQLLEQCINFAKENGYEKIDTGMAENQPHSVQWMKNRKFNQIGRFVELNLNIEDYDSKQLENFEEKLDGYEFTSLKEELINNSNAVRVLYDTLAFPLLQLVTMPGGSTMNPTFEEFKSMFVEDVDAKKEGQIIVKDNNEYIGYCALFMGEDEFSYISYIDLKREYIDKNIEMAMLLKTIELSKSFGYKSIKTHVESGSVIKSFIDAMNKVGFKESPGRLIWNKNI